MSDQTRDTRQFFAYLETAKKWAVTPPEKWERGKLLTVHGIQSKPEINGQIVEIFNSGSLDAEGVLRFKCALCEPLEGGSFTRNSFLQLKASCLSCIPLPTDPELLTELTDIMLHLQLVTDFAEDEEEHQHDHVQLVTEAQQKVTRALTIWPAAGGMWMYRAHSLYHRPHLDLRKVDLLWRALGNGFSDVPAGNLAIHSQLADELEKDGAKTFSLRCELFEALKLRYQHDGSDTWEVALAIQMLKGSEQGYGRSAEEREATLEAVLDKLEHLKRKGTATGLKSSVGRNEVDLVRRTIPAALSRFWFLAMEAQARGRRETPHSPSALVHFREAERLLVWALKSGAIPTQPPPTHYSTCARA